MLRNFLLSLLMGFLLIWPAEAVIIEQHERPENAEIKTKVDTEASSTQKSKDSSDKKSKSKVSKKTITNPNGAFATSNGRFTTATTVPTDKEDDSAPDEGEKDEHPDGHHHRHPQILSPIVLPVGFSSIAANGEIYYYHEGVFYQLFGDVLESVESPLGAEVDRIPTKAVKLQAEEGVYYLYQGTYFQKVGGWRYKVVRPPA